MALDNNLWILYDTLGFNSPDPLIKTSLELTSEIIEHDTSLIRALSPTRKLWSLKRFNL